MRVVIIDAERKNRALEMIKGLPENGSMAVQIEYWKKIKTKAQRNTAHFWIETIARETGNNSKELKRLIKKAIGAYDITTIDGEKCIELRSSEDFTREEYSEFMNAIEMMAHETKTILPIPLDERN